MADPEGTIERLNRIRAYVQDALDTGHCDGGAIGNLMAVRDEVDVLTLQASRAAPPVPMFLTCPGCGTRHIDEGEFATKSHHTHSCQACGLTWRPAIPPTVGVQFLPGFKNED